METTYFDNKWGKEYRIIKVDSNIIKMESTDPSRHQQTFTNEFFKKLCIDKEIVRKLEPKGEW